MKKRKLLVGLLAAFAAFGLASCNDTTPTKTTTTATATATKTQTQTATKTGTATATKTAQKTVVKFDSDGGNTIANADVTAGKATKPANPVKNDYAFAGWFTAKDYETEFDFDDVTATTTAYAKWLKINTYAEVMAAADGDDIAVGAYIAAKQSYYKGGTLYLVDANKNGYFGYQIAMTQDEYNNTFTVGTYVTIAGVRTSYSGEVEIASAGSVITKVADKPAMKLQAVDVTDKLADLTAYKNGYFTATLSVKEYVAADPNVAAASKAYGYNNAMVDKNSGEPYDDLYFTLTDGTNDLACCIEMYLTGTSTDVYKAVKGLTIGDTVTVTGYMYWWNGANPHIVTLTKVAD